jgi:hypothetical protein
MFSQRLASREQKGRTCAPSGYTPVRSYELFYLSFHPRPDARQRLGEFPGILAAAEGQVRRAAPSSLLLAVECFFGSVVMILSL